MEYIWDYVVILPFGRKHVWMWVLVILRQVIWSVGPWNPMWNSLVHHHHMLFPLGPCLTTILICSRTLEWVHVPELSQNPLWLIRLYVCPNFDVAKVQCLILERSKVSTWCIRDQTTLIIFNQSNKNLVPLALSVPLNSNHLAVSGLSRSLFNTFSLQGMINRCSNTYVCKDMKYIFSVK